MAPGCRLVKMSVFSHSIAAPRKAEWLLHLDPKAEVGERPLGLEVVQGRAALDLRVLVPSRALLSVGRHRVAKPEVEPFTFRETQRVVIEPPFVGDETTLITLLHVRPREAAPLEGATGRLEAGRARLSWSEGGEDVVVDWDLGARRVSLQRTTRGPRRGAPPPS